MSHERVHFRLLVTPCCGSNLCWVNPRLPTYCPECGHRFYPEIKSCVSFSDEGARLEIPTWRAADSSSSTLASPPTPSD